MKIKKKKKKKRTPTCHPEDMKIKKIKI